jgi:hypothetical protein
MHQEQNIIKIFDIPKLTMDCRNWMMLKMQTWAVMVNKSKHETDEKIVK